MKTDPAPNAKSPADHAPQCIQTSDGPGPPSPPRPEAPPRPDANGQLQKFEKPVAWLFGRQLIRSIKGILLYTAYGSKLDPRDWMTATVHSFVPAAPERPGPEPSAEIEQLYPDEFWFDYISDTGDGMRATYSIAYLCLSNLNVPSLDPKRLKAGDAALPIDSKRPAGPAVLPRGEFLFVGGDTAYHASDYMTLIQRFFNTFNWAYEDVTRNGGLDANDPPRPIFGIPGNHDYYDQLDGFRRQFHRAVLWEPLPDTAASAQKPAHLDTAETAQLTLRGFYRTQGASYIALRLPFDWHLWGLDTETGQIDERQKKFFRQFCRTAGSDLASPRQDIVIPPKKLIVATCSPTTFFGKLANPKDFKSADAFGQLGIEQPFLPTSVKKAREVGEALGIPYDLTETGDRRLKRGQCRLDLSGDVHHYARYWGPEPPPCSVTVRPGEDERLAKLEANAAKREELRRKNQPRADSYASVVSGIGGAFHHPSQTYFGHVREQSLYPSEKTSTAEVARRVFKFWNIVTGGGVWVAGLVLALLVYFAFAVPQSSRDVLNNLPIGFGLTTHETINPTVRPALPEEGTVIEKSDCEDPDCVKPLWHKVADIRWPSPPPCGPNEPHYFFGPCSKGKWPLDFGIGLFMAVVLSCIPLIYATFSKKLYGVAPEEKEEEEGGEQPPKRAYPGITPGTDTSGSEMADTPEGNKIRPIRLHAETEAHPGPVLWLCTVVAALLFFVGLAMVKPYRSHITPFGSSLLVLLTLVWAGACVALNIRYTEFLYKKAQGPTVHKSDWWLTWVLAVLTIISVGMGLWSFGRNNLPALLISDMLFIGAMLALFVGVVFALPLVVGSEMFPRLGKWKGRALKVLIGAWHFVLQLAVPFILVRKASVASLLVAVVVVALGPLIGERLLARFKGWALFLVWVVLGLATLAAPIWLASIEPAGGILTKLWFEPNPETGLFWTGWYGLIPAVVAGLIGVVMCCYWFGWYLGVCFAFNGHNNEVGGAARIEQFKQFIRFRLTDKGLTGYVIAVNDPSDTGGDLTPHVVDVFHLHPKA